MAGRLFSFTENGDGVRVTSHDLYEEQKGYGFLDCSTTSVSADRFTGTGGWNLREETEGKQDFQPPYTIQKMGQSFWEREYPCGSGRRFLKMEPMRSRLLSGAEGMESAA